MKKVVWRDNYVNEMDLFSFFNFFLSMLPLYMFSPYKTVLRANSFANSWKFLLYAHNVPTCLQSSLVCDHLR